MSFVKFLIPAFFATCVFISLIACAIKGMYILACDEDGWKSKVLGFVLIIIPLTILLALCMWSEHSDNVKQPPVQIESNH